MRLIRNRVADRGHHLLVPRCVLRGFAVVTLAALALGSCTPKHPRGAATVLGTQFFSPSASPTGAPLPTPSVLVPTPSPTPVPASPGSTPAALPSQIPAHQPAPAPAVVCRNSTDPACGAFYFDPRPGTNTSNEIEVTIAPGSPNVGDTVTFDIVWSDPDAPAEGRESSEDYGDGVVNARNTARPACTAHGPWTPARPSGGRHTQTVTHVYRTAGHYVVKFTRSSATPGAPAGCKDARTGHWGDPYENADTITFTLDVTGASPSPSASPTPSPTAS